MRRLRVAFLAAIFVLGAGAQVYSPEVLLKGQPDSSNLRKLAEGIYANARALTPRERAEAVWRFFLAEGRFVKPGFWYHIAGWAYEEPAGEVLDPLKLLNSYGFGLCYHIAPLLEAVDLSQRGAAEIVLVKGDGADDGALAQWIARLGKLYIPNRAIFVADGTGGGFIPEQARGRPAVDGKLTGYVCRSCRTASTWASSVLSSRRRCRVALLEVISCK